MRLIDADALVSVVETARKKARTLTGMDFVMVTENQHTIDAIPVEWLKSKRKEALHEGMRPDEVEAVEMVLWMWQKEQEAR